jgi:hypothetical protein
MEPVAKREHRRGLEASVLPDTQMFPVFPSVDGAEYRAVAATFSFRKEETDGPTLLTCEHLEVTEVCPLASGAAALDHFDRESRGRRAPGHGQRSGQHRGQRHQERSGQSHPVSQVLSLARYRLEGSALEGSTQLAMPVQQGDDHDAPRLDELDETVGSDDELPKSRKLRVGIL